MLSRLLRSRLAAGLNPLTGKRKSSAAAAADAPQERTSAVIGSLMRDAKEAYAEHSVPLPEEMPHEPEEAPCSPTGAIQSEAETASQIAEAQADPGDLSACVLDILNNADWEDWVTARCDFPEAGPFVQTGTSAALKLLGEIVERVLQDAGNDGEDLTVSFYAGREPGSARLTVTGPFDLSLDTLGAIKRHRRQFESFGGALYTVRTLGTSGFEALIPER